MIGSQNRPLGLSSHFIGMYFDSCSITTEHSEGRSVQTKLSEILTLDPTQKL